MAIENETRRFLLLAPPGSATGRDAVAPGRRNGCGRTPNGFANHSSHDAVVPDGHGGIKLMGHRPGIRPGWLRGRVAVFAICFAIAAHALAQPAALTPNYRDTDIRQVIEAVGAVTGRNFLVDPRVRANVTLVTNTPMSAQAFYQAFLATLAVHGYTAVEDGAVTKIIPDANARQVLPTTSGNKASDALVTRVVKVENVSAGQLVPVLRPLMPQYAYLSANQQSNMLLIADRAGNVERILGIVHAMDKAADQNVEVIPLEHASAVEVVRMLGALSPTAQAGAAPAAMVVADERTNSVLLSGSEAERLRFRGLIAYLDVPSQTGDTRVRYLNYADAEDLAKKLQTQFAGAGATAAAAGAKAASPQSVTIWADKDTNALVIDAPGKLLQDIMSIIDKIDIPRAQVAVDAIIVELTEQKAAQLGVTWISGGSGDKPVIGLTNFGAAVPGIVQLGAAAAGGTPNPSAIPNGIVLGIGALTEGGTNWAALLSALKGDATTNIISTPHIVTLDNETASIDVGQKVPFVTGQFTNAGSATPGVVNPFQTIQREDVGTSLEITPQINEGSGVKLTIIQKTSSISSSAQGAVDLVTNNRKIETTVFVKDGQVLVLGGLMDNELRQNDQHVPVLGRIPGLGWLFRARKADRVKTNLMVFIRPTILRNNVQTRFRTSSKYNYIRNLQLEQAKKPVMLMKDEVSPVLPPFPAAPVNEKDEADATGLRSNQKTDTGKAADTIPDGDTSKASPPDQDDGR